MTGPQNGGQVRYRATSGATSSSQAFGHVRFPSAPVLSSSAWSSRSRSNSSCASHSCRQSTRRGVRTQPSCGPELMGLGRWSPAGRPVCLWFSLGSARPRTGLPPEPAGPLLQACPPNSPRPPIYFKGGLARISVSAQSGSSLKGRAGRLGPTRGACSSPSRAARACRPGSWGAVALALGETVMSVVGAVVPLLEHQLGVVHLLLSGHHLCGWRGNRGGSARVGGSS